MSRSSLLIAASAIVAIPAPALAQQMPTPADPQPTEDPSDEIVVVGERVRGSAIGEVAPVATLGGEAITALGATNLTELLQRLKGVTTSSSGADPVFLLNGRRISGFSEMQNIPPEAIERTEVLPEQEAPRFGFPPTVRIVNFITKRQFRSIAVQQLAGTSTEGGAATNYAETTATRIEGDRRTSLTASYLRQNRLLQSQRDVRPDAASPFTIDGSTPADIGPFRTLEPRNDRIRVDGTVASPLGAQIAGSLNLSMEARRADGLNGPAAGVLNLSGDADDGLLFRYFPQAVLRQRTTDLTLHAAGTLQGSARRWTWNATATYDRLRGTVAADQGIPLAGLQAAIDAGGDPLAPLDPATAAARLRSRSTTITGTLVGKAVATGPVLRLPAGDAQLTVTTDLARSDSDARAFGTGVAPVALSRTTKGASVAIDAPIVSPSGDFLPFLGRLGANASVGVSGVSDFGRLASASIGMNWTPTPPLQFTASVSDARAAPAIALLTNPLLEAPNVPFFDFATGTSVFVTTRTGGNPALAPERRRIVTLGTALKPFRKREFRLTLDYLDTRITDQSVFPGGATADFQRAFANRYVRDAAGLLTLADLRPVNIAEEVERKLRFGINLWTPIGRAPPPPPAPPKSPATPPPADAPPPKPPRQRPTLYVSGSATWRLSDEVVLQPGAPRLDLLDGATLNGADARPRWEVEGNISGSIGPANLGVYGRLQGPARIRSPIPAADLAFSGRTWLVVYGFLDAEKLVGKPWARRMSLNLTVENLLNDRILVRDRLGETPFRYQGALIDPIGRLVRLGVRKLF